MSIILMKMQKYLQLHVKRRLITNLLTYALFLKDHPSDTTAKERSFGQNKLLFMNALPFCGFKMLIFSEFEEEIDLCVYAKVVGMASNLI